MRKKVVAALCLLVMLVAGCGDSGDSSASGDSCQPGDLATVQAGALTIATRKPLAPPYFADGDPSSGKGFESAVAYAIADRLGYPRTKVEWKVEPLGSLTAPGPKGFDFALGQVPVAPSREEAVDFSAPYYTPKQAVVALKKEAWVEPDFVLSMEIVKNGVQRGTSSHRALRERISPQEKPLILERFGEVVSALKQGRVEAMIVELPAALEVVARMPEAHVVAQFSPPGGAPWGALLEKGSPLTSCVSEAIDDLRASGELQKITVRWMSRSIRVPILS